MLLESPVDPSDSLSPAIGAPRIVAADSANAKALNFCFRNNFDSIQLNKHLY
jgi:hypothetical protein